jgi:hypothetical protein
MHCDWNGPVALCPPEGTLNYAAADFACVTPLSQKPCVCHLELPTTCQDLTSQG